MNGKERFKNLGFEITWENEDAVEYYNSKTYDIVVFDLKEKTYYFTKSASVDIVSPELHLAIHQSVLDFGWLTEFVSHKVNK